MAKITKPMDQWTFEDYIESMAHSSRLGGVTDGFKPIFTMLNELREIEQSPISQDMVYDRSQKLDQIRKAAEQYIAENEKRNSGTSKERRDMMDFLGKFCVQEKTVTSFDANVRFFKGRTLQELRTGATFNELDQLYRDVTKIEDGAMTEEKVIKFVNKATRMVQAAESFMNANPHVKRYKRKVSLFDFARVEGGPSAYPYDYAMAIVEEYKPFLDSARDIRKFTEVKDEVLKNQNREATWKDLLEVRPAEYIHNGMTETVGDAVNERMKITYKGKKGFFTASESILTDDQLFARSIEFVGDPRTKEALRKNRSALRTAVGTTATTYSRSMAHMVNVCEMWDYMEPSPQKEMLKALLKEDGAEKALDTIITGYKDRIKEIPTDQLSELKKMQIFDQTIHESQLGSNMKAVLTVNAKTIRTYAEHANVREEGKGSLGLRLRLDCQYYSQMLKADLATEEGKALFESRQALVRDEAAKTELIKIAKKSRGATAATTGLAQLKYGDELANRNVASSRIAELLGVGNLLAHSEKMTVTMPDGKKVEGCFMEFAEGLDLRNGGVTARQTASDVEFTVNAGFTKDACSLEILDYICAQTDRHGGNMFVKLSEPGSDGKRNIIGIQGIDNDLAFTAKSLQEEVKLKQGDLEDLIFIDEDLANRIRGLDREMLVTAVGDLLNEKEIDALVLRVENVQKHLDKEMIPLKDEQWNLDADPKDFGEKGTVYQNAVKDIHNMMKSSLNPYNQKHKNYHVYRELHMAKETYKDDVVVKEANEKLINKTFEAFGSMFESAEADAVKVEQEERAKRTAIFDKLVAEKEKTAKTEPKVNTPLSSRGLEQKEGPNVGAAKDVEKETMSAKVPKKGVFTSVKELEQHEKPTIRSRTAVPAKEPKKEDLGYGFIEITKDDIEKANKRLPNLKIGGHRGPKK